ncbi:MAG: formate dehydrogenase accessory protein FdhE [Dehalococcoidia bacterium]|jgi:transcription elongation factor Elf1
MGSGSYEKVIKKLEELERASLPESVDLYVRLTRLQLEARADIEKREARPSRKEIDERVGLGVRALEFDELYLDWTKIEALFRRALMIIGEYTPGVDADVAVPLRQVVESWYNKQPFQYGGMDEEILVAAVHAAAKPFLAGWAEELLPMISQESWRRGFCPVCGGTPNFAYLEPENGARWLCCPRCDAEWLFQRLECPFCGNSDQKKLAFFSDEKGLYRVYTCEVCRGYLKAVDMRKGLKDISLPLEWIKTLDMDRQACERGYQAGMQGKSIDDRGDTQAP